MGPLKVWKGSGFTLKLWDRNGLWRGRRRLGYKLYDGGRLIFKGEDFGPSPMHADDSRETVAALLAFLSLRKGDTDAEYFSDYTSAQLAWRDSGRAEELSAIAHDMEERAARRRKARR